MNSTLTGEIIKRFLQFLTQRDLHNLTGLFDENIDWDIPGDTIKAPWLGKRHTRNEVKDFYELLWKHTEPVSASVHNIFVDNADAVISGDFTTKMLKTGNTLNSIFFIQITVKDGLIIKYRLLEDSYAVSMALTMA